MKRLIVGLTLAVFAAAGSLQAGDAKQCPKAAAACCDKAKMAKGECTDAAKAACEAKAKAGCPMTAQAKAGQAGCCATKTAAKKPLQSPRGASQSRS